MRQHNGLPRNSSAQPCPGKVFFVGAGPGDPGLVTLRGVHCLRQADLVLYDYLVNALVLRHSPPSAEMVGLGHHATKTIDQEAINRLMIEAAWAGKTVVRLKGGDPMVFGRSAEEIQAIESAGVPFEIVPGVTAATAAAAYTGISITHADYSSAVALVTGQERHSKGAPPLDYAALARFPGTVVFYMGVTSAARWSQAMLREGKPAETPVAIVRRCSWTDQSTYRCTLATVAETIAAENIRPPAVILVGEVVAHAGRDSWFTQRPLFGQRILVTRPRQQVEAFADLLADYGAEVLVQPAIEIADPHDWTPVDRALGRLDEYDWVVFSSANGVNRFLDRLPRLGRDLRALAPVKLAAIGPGTAEALAAYRLRADLVPEQYRAEALAEALVEQAPGRRFLLVRASRGREVLAERLAAAGGAVEQVVAYQSLDVAQPDPDIAAALRDGRIDWITVTSSAIAKSLGRLFGDDLRRAKLASISPITSETLRSLGYAPAVEATEYTMNGLAAAILASVVT
ncbi:MAG: uroporphyrinogen-III C-methyltransferase [Thermoguttaceae bacterium]|nr:uroporphyrinogen-III C-methyltransferase [Thermoguttaceae bacterium]